MKQLLGFPHIPLPRQPRCSPYLQIALGQPTAGLDQLDNIYPLLPKHDGEANARNHPGPEGIHLVGSRELERTGTVWVREE